MLPYFLPALRAAAQAPTGPAPLAYAGNLENLKGVDDTPNHCFLQVDTDEVYGSLAPDDPAFTETTAFAPNSPYSASEQTANWYLNNRTWWEAIRDGAYRDYYKKQYSV